MYILYDQESIERWRKEIKKDVLDSAVVSAKEVLQLIDGFDTADLRSAYKKLARKCNKTFLQIALLFLIIIVNILLFHHHYYFYYPHIL